MDHPTYPVIEPIDAAERVLVQLVRLVVDDDLAAVDAARQLGHDTDVAALRFARARIETTVGRDPSVVSTRAALILDTALWMKAGDS